MDSNQEQLEPAAGGVAMLSIVTATLKKWPLIVLSVVVCVGLALLYVMRATPVYTRTAAIVIKEESGGKSVSSDLGAFADMGLIQSHSNIIDEVNKLQSPDVIKEVVKQLNLEMRYYVDGLFHKNLIYGSQLPISVSLPSVMDREKLSMTVELSDDGKYQVSKLRYNDENATSVTDEFIALGDTLNTTAGKIVVSKTPYYGDGHPDKIYVVKAPMKATVVEFSHKLNVGHKKDDGNTIQITVSDQSTQRAEDIINAVINVYNENWMDNRNQIAVSTSNFINERLSVIEHELGNVDRDISSYQSEHLIPDVQQAASMYMTENQATSAQILALNNQLQMTRYMKEYLMDEGNKSQLLPTNSGIQSPSIEKQITEYNTTMLQRNQLAANSSDTHPVVMDMDAVLAGIRSAILSTIDNHIISLNTQIKNLQSSKNRTTAQIAANPTQAKYLLSVERQQKVKESLYLFLLQKREENELSQAFTAYNTQIIATPDGADTPTSPKKGQILMIAFVIGLIIPFGVTYLREIIDNKVRSRKDLDGLSVPFLGEIPAYKPKDGSAAQQGVVAVQQGKRDIINEAFRVLRTNISFITAQDKKCSVIMITSFNPGSGKTFLSTNMGISLSLKGKKVLIIDGDLRRASTSVYVNSPKTGLSNYLAGATDDVSSIIVSDTLSKGLSIIPVGTIPPNPTELLETDRFSTLIETLRDSYDYIMIDCPPVEMMADAQIIERVVDRTIFVVRAGLLDRSMLPELDKLAATKKFKNLSLILNATVIAGRRYGYGYGYGDYGKYLSGKA